MSYIKNHYFEEINQSQNFEDYDYQYQQFLLQFEKEEQDLNLEVEEDIIAEMISFYPF